MNKLSNRLWTFALLILGAVAGAGLALLAQGAAETALTGTIAVGLAAGFAMFVVFLSLRTFLSVSRPTPESLARNETIRSLSSYLAGANGEDRSSEAKQRIAKEAGSVLSTGAAFWAAGSAMIAAIGLVGGVFGAIASLAALQQVERLTKQNQLIEEQLLESKTTREVQVFATMLDLVLSAIEEISPAKAAPPYPSPEKTLDLGPQQLNISQDIVVRVNAVLTSFTPYRRSPNFPRLEKLFSPEKGRIFAALRVAGFPFARLTPTQDLDFSGSQFPRLNLDMINLGYLNLSNSDMSELSLIEADLSNSEVRGALFPAHTALAGVNLGGVDLSEVKVRTAEFLARLSRTTSALNLSFENRCVADTLGTYPVLEFDLWEIRGVSNTDLDAQTQYQIVKKGYSNRLVDLIEARRTDAEATDGVVDYSDVPFEDLAEISKEVKPELFGDPRLYGGHPALYEHDPQFNRSRGRILEFFAEADGLTDLERYIENGGSFAGALVVAKNSAWWLPDVASADFSGAALMGMTFDNTNLANANFSNSILPPANRFLGADLTDAKLDGAYVNEGWLSAIEMLQPPPAGFKPSEWREIEKFSIPIHREGDCSIIDHYPVMVLQRVP